MECNFGCKGEGRRVQTCMWLKMHKTLRIQQHHRRSWLVTTLLMCQVSKYSPALLILHACRMESEALQTASLTIALSRSDAHFLHTRVAAGRHNDKAAPPLVGNTCASARLAGLAPSPYSAVLVCYVHRPLWPWPLRPAVVDRKHILTQMLAPSTWTS